MIPAVIRDLSDSGIHEFKERISCDSRLDDGLVGESDQTLFQSQERTEQSRDCDHEDKQDLTANVSESKDLIRFLLFHPKSQQTRDQSQEIDPQQRRTDSQTWHMFSVTS